MHDLISHDWPVLYPKVDGALSYYIGYWLPAAFLGKIIFWLSGSSLVAWRAANAFLVLFTVCGVTLSLLLVLSVIRTDKTQQLSSCMMILLLGVFFLFGGLDVLAACLSCVFRFIKGMPFYFEWREMDSSFGTNFFQFSSHTTLISWVFNQTVLSWVATALVICNRRIDTLGVVLFPLVIVAPFPLAGLCLLVLVQICWIGWHQKRLFVVVRKAFSLTNLLACVGFAIMPLLFLMTNMTKGSIDLFLHWTAITPLCYLGFLLIELGWIIAFTKNEAYNPWLFGAVLLMALMPILYIGRWIDFGMRAVIPEFFILFIFTAEKVLKEYMHLRWWWLVLGVVGIAPLCSIGSTLITSAQISHECGRQYGCWPDYALWRDFRTFDVEYETLAKGLSLGKWWVYYCEHASHSFFFAKLSRACNLPPPSVMNGRSDLKPIHDKFEPRYGNDGR